MYYKGDTRSLDFSSHDMPWKPQLFGLMLAEVQEKQSYHLDEGQEATKGCTLH